MTDAQAGPDQRVRCEVDDLDEGYQMVTNLVGLTPDAITPDLPVQVEFHHAGGGLHLPYFRPRAGRAA
jgi:hypothetical protein